jgi:phosphate uptake regulator
VKRKVIQIAKSTQLVSLPREWAIANGINKGDEVEVEMAGSRLIITPKAGSGVESATVDLRGLELMSSRYIHAMYKRGVDELTLLFDKPETLETIKNALSKETVGYEITEQGRTSCVIRHVSGELEDFDVILRRTFLMLTTMANDAYNEIKDGNFSHLKHVAYLEEANNRFTTSCRRLLNKKGSDKFDKLGPIYYIIEDIENIADHYKYLCQYASDKPGKIHPDALEMLHVANQMLEGFYKLFYVMDNAVVEQIGRQRKEVIKRFYAIMEDRKNGTLDYVIAHQAMTIAHKIFCLTGPYLVLAVKEMQK